MRDSTTLNGTGDVLQILFHGQKRDASQRCSRQPVSPAAHSATKRMAGSNGNVAPVATISCGGLNLPDGAAVDSLGNLYVANLQGDSISIFPSRANGCVKASHIRGRRTQLSHPAGAMISGSQLFITNTGTHSITVYPTSARGDVRPSRKIEGSNTGL